MTLIPLPAFQEQRPLVDARRASVLQSDPGEAHSAPARLQRDGLQLEAILVTHHHPDEFKCK
jgi:hydroxyacylglutathione hydrolase